VVFWKFKDPSKQEDQAEAETDEAAESKRKVFARGYFVFNANQVDGYPPEPLPIITEKERIAAAEIFFQSTGAVIRHGGARAYYSPGLDHIQMPPFEAFPEAEGYYSVLGHELTHWTGAKARLDRDLSGRFASQPYAMEELVAELGSAFLAADLGISNAPRPDHAAYVANWLTVLRSDNRAIFTAAAKAQQAVDFAHSLQPTPAMGLSPRAAGLDFSPG